MYQVKMKNLVRKLLEWKILLICLDQFLEYLHQLKYQEKNPRTLVAFRVNQGLKIFVYYQPYLQESIFAEQGETLNQNTK